MKLDAPIFTDPSSSTFEERRKAVIEFFATRSAGDYIDHTELMEIAAKLFAGRYDDDARSELISFLTNPSGDMFWMVPVTLVTLAGRDALGGEERDLLRSNWRRYTPYRGDTENHWLMYHAVMYLMAEFYPNEDGDFWFNGRTSSENLEEAREYLEYWMALTTTHGQIEFDSPHYLAFFVTPLAMLYGWARDEKMRRLARMMLDLLLAGFAAESLNGLAAGAFSRVYPEPLLERWKNPTSTLSWLLFGNIPFRPSGVNVVLPRVGYRPHAVSLAVAMSGYHPPSALQAIATDRSEPYVHVERHRTRTRIRFADTPVEPVYKTSYVTKDFVLGSINGGLVQPIQQHSWELLWATDDPFEGFNVLFSLHPYASDLELGMFFPEEPELLEEAVIRGEKPTYGKPDKWTGASPFEQIYQHRNSLIAIYHIPAGTRYPHISAFFSRSLEDLTEDPSGWIFARGGRAMIAYHPLAPFIWQNEPGGHRRLHSRESRNGAVVHVDSADNHSSLQAFSASILQCRLEVELQRDSSVTFQTPEGDVLEARYRAQPRLNGEPVDYEHWPLIDGKFARNPDDGLVELGSGNQRIELDFKADF